MPTFPLFTDCWLYVEQICKDFIDLNKSLKKNIIEFDNSRQNNDIKVASHLKTNLKEGSLHYFKEESNDTSVIEKLIIQHSINAVSEKTGSEYINHEYSFTISNSWYHITSLGGHHDYHSHDGCALSGIYYVSVDECGENNGINRFYKPFTVGNHDVYGPLSEVMKDNVDVVPKNGNIIIFPAFLPHSAIPYIGRESRIVIGFNINLIKKG
tara:strand:+ start:636 stop:1268 length:633 start_codon:yes stop_codon:yes gene_type:complete